MLSSPKANKGLGRAGSAGRGRWDLQKLSFKPNCRLRGFAVSPAKQWVVQVVSLGWPCSSTELKVCMIEDIESFRPELQLVSLRNAESLED